MPDFGYWAGRLGAGFATPITVTRSALTGALVVSGTGRRMASHAPCAHNNSNVALATQVGTIAARKSSMTPTDSS
jgi:hypothetical protein